MTILDQNLLFSSGQTVTATADSTNILDFGVAEDLGNDERPLQVFTDWTTAPVGSSVGTTTIQYSLLCSATGTSAWTTLYTGPATVYSSVPRYGNPIDLPQNCQRFVKLNYAIASGSLTAGVITAGLVLDADGGQKYYPRGYTA